MADDEILDEGEDEELNFVAIFIAAAVLLALIGGGVWYFFIREAPVEEQAVEEAEVAEVEATPAPKKVVRRRKKA